jgi:8-oxo-dGTP pyrophosphatase MutT (NUDIX family)
MTGADESLGPRPTHAGGVVYRRRDGVPEFLLVTARKRPQDWLLPKGHVEKDETPEETAIREVEEEAGVVAVIERFLEQVVLDLAGDRQHIRFYLMRALREGASREGRGIAWLPAESAIRKASFPQPRELLRAAVAAVTERARPR